MELQIRHDFFSCLKMGLKPLIFDACSEYELTSVGQLGLDANVHVTHCQIWSSLSLVSIFVSDITLFQYFNLGEKSYL